jgi:hypothetical protein
MTLKKKIHSVINDSPLNEAFVDQTPQFATSLIHKSCIKILQSWAKWAFPIYHGDVSER